MLSPSQRIVSAFRLWPCPKTRTSPPRAGVQQRRHHAVDAFRHVCRSLSAGSAVAPQLPGRILDADVGGRTTFVRAVVPLDEVIADLGLVGEAGDLAGLHGASERTREHAVEPGAVQAAAEVLGEGASLVGEGEIGRAGVLAAQAPLRLGVTDEHDALARVLGALIHGRGRGRSRRPRDPIGPAARTCSTPSCRAR